MEAIKGQVVEFTLPKRRPKVEQKEAPPDRRKVAVLPIKAVADKRVTDGMFRTLAVLCSYCNRAGITWVSTERMGKDMGVTKQAISKQLVKLQKLGYVEIIKKHAWGHRTATNRVIFDPTVSTEDAIALTSTIEDTRPPFMSQRDQEIMDIMQDNQRPDITPQELTKNRKRLETLTKDIKEIAKKMTTQPRGGYTMPADGVTKAVKEARAKIKTRTRKPVGTPSYSQPTVDCTDTHIVNLESKNSSTSKVDMKHDKNISNEMVYRMYESVNNGAVISDTDSRWVSLLVEAGVTQADLNEALLAKRGASLTAVCQVLLARLGV